jgi:rubrerythrin
MKTSIEKLSEHNKDKLLDLLAERLTFERAGVRLYDSILARLTRAGEDEGLARMIPTLREHRDEEKEHEEWLEEQIRALGGDVHAETEMSKLVEVESTGIEKVILDGDPKIPHLFHALLVAELVDNAGWELLVELADEAGDREAKRGFKKRLEQEEDHLTFARRVMERFARAEVLGEDVKMPASP